jgi:threonine/homoserine/homoserine lactone efflux protein
MTELAGKAKRVLGTFVLMVGAGIVLDSSAGWAGTVIMLIGVAFLIWGLAEAWPRATVTLPGRDSHSVAAASKATEGNP